MEELKPCPFCGDCKPETFNAEEEVMKYDEITFGFIGYEKIFLWGAGCYNCSAQVYGYDTEQEAIEAWNTRANDTLEPKKVVSAERTCTTTEYPTGETWIICKSCNSCNFGWHVSIYDKPFSYCPNCGAKVVE